MRSCPEIEALIASRLVGELAAEEALELRRHLKLCAACAELADTMTPPDDGAAADHAALPDVAPAVYAMGREIARGGMGRILTARDRRIGRQVAIKELLDRGRHATRFENKPRHACCERTAFAGRAGDRRTVRVYALW